jgi:CheY-like chemotaxis protein
MPLVEVMTVTARIKDLITQGASTVEIHDVVAEQGERFLRSVGGQRVEAGDTTLEELERVLGDVAMREPEAEPTPAKKRAMSPAEVLAAAAAAEAEEAGEDEHPHILVVDDDGANRTIAKAILESEKFRVSEAKDGIEGLEVLRTGASFSLVVLDLDMPRMGGREFLQKVRGNMATVGLPVIVLTGTTDSDTEFILMEEGADDYIRKPFDPRRFMTRVKAALRRAGG